MEAQGSDNLVSVWSTKKIGRNPKKTAYKNRAGILG
jgi:hypothetical protein